MCSSSDPTRRDSRSRPRPSLPAGRRRSVVGFSLVELMVVIVVMTILAGVLVPDFSGDRDEAKLRVAGRTLLSTLRFAASHSATMTRVHRLQIDPASRRYWLEAQDDKREFRPIPDMMYELDESLRIQVRRPDPKEAGPDTGADAEPPPDPITEEDARIYGGFVNAELERIYFRPDGTADAREILLQAVDQEGMLLTINPTTARITLVRVDADGLPIGSLAGDRPPVEQEPEQERDPEPGENPESP